MQFERAIQQRDGDGRIVTNADVLQRGIQALKDQHQATTDTLQRWTIERNIEQLERRLRLGAAPAEKRDSLTAGRQVDRPALPEDSGDPSAEKLLMGYAAVFNSESKDLGGFVEVIRPGAFKKVLSGNDDTMALLNHEESSLLGRRSSRTLVLGEDSKGLRFQVRPGKSQLWRDVDDMLTRRDLSQCSFAFIVGREEWQTRAKEPPLRIIHEVAALRDVSIVANPAYDATTAEMLFLRFGMRSVDAEFNLLCHEVDLLKLKAPRIGSK